MRTSSPPGYVVIRGPAAPNVPGIRLDTVTGFGGCSRLAAQIPTKENAMKLRTLVFVAAAATAGYLLGTKAGRAQFEQIKAKADELAHDPRVRSQVSNLAGEVKSHADKLPDPVSGAVRAAADAVEHATKN